MCEKAVYLEGGLEEQKPIPRVDSETISSNSTHRLLSRSLACLVNKQCCLEETHRRQEIRTRLPAVIHRQRQSTNAPNSGHFDVSKITPHNTRSDKSRSSHPLPPRHSAVER